MKKILFSKQNKGGIRMKRITSIMLSVILALTVVPMFSICAAATPTSTLIPISTKEQFYNIRNDVTANYYLTNDIVFDERDFLKNGKFYNDGYGWLGVDSVFIGTLDGRGHCISGIRNYDRAGAILFTNNVGTIKNLIISDLMMDAESGNGYIVETNTGTIQNCSFYDISYTLDVYNSVNEAPIHTNNGQILNCNLKDVTVLNSDYIRSVAGFVVINNGTIANCANNIESYPISSNATGICYSNFGNVYNCVNNMDVIFKKETCGGIVGNNYGNVEKCQNNGNLVYMADGYSYLAETCFGGIVGYNEGTIENCVNKASVTVANYAYTAYVGGMCGYNSAGTIQKSTNIGSVSPIDNFFYDSGLFSATVVGLFDGGSVKDNYYLESALESAIISSSSFSFIEPLECTEAQLKNPATFTALDFSSVWYIPTNSYPELTELKSDTVKEIIIKRLPNKVRYTQIETLDFAGIQVAKVLNFGQIEILAVGYDINGSLSTYGVNTIEVDYKELKTSFDIVLCVPLDDCYVDLEYESVTYTGAKSTPQITVTYRGRRLTQNKDFTILYTNNLNVGTASIKITGINNYTGTLTKSFIINPVQMNDVQISGITDKTFNKTKQTQNVQLTYNGKSLFENVDYTISYKNNLNAGNASVTFSGMNNFSGIVTKTFTINKVKMSNTKVTGIYDKTYNGKEKTQNIDITCGNIVLVKNADYKVSYKNNKNAGKATVLIEGINNYQGKLTKTFTIKKVDISSAKVKGIKAQTYNGKTKKQNITISVNNQKLVNNKDYKITYKNNKNAGKATVLIEGINNYKGSLTKTFTIKKADISSAKVKGIKAQIYNGKAKKQNITVSFGGKKLVNNKDYKIVYKNNKYVGKATVKIVGIKNYSGTISKYFTIKKADQKLNCKLYINGGKNILSGKLSSTAKTKISYYIDNKKIAKVGANGKLTIIKPGTVVITIKANSTGSYNSAIKKIKLKIVSKNGRLYPRNA